MKKKKYCVFCGEELRMRFWLVPSRTVCPKCGTVYYTRGSITGRHEVYHCHFPTDDWYKGYTEGIKENV